MEISNSDGRAVIRYFSSVNPEIDGKMVDWKKGMPIELNVIYSYHDTKNRCIAMWTDFRMQEMDQRTMEIIFERVSLLDCEFFMYHSSKRYRIGFRVNGVI